jgi:hypothetical protein
MQSCARVGENSLAVHGFPLHDLKDKSLGLSNIPKIAGPMLS